MESQARTEARAQVDHAFLETVGIEIAKALEQSAGLEAESASFTVELDQQWQHSFAKMSQNLASWQSRLSELAQKTAQVESDLSEQEQSMRVWFQTLRVTSERLARIGAVR